VILIATAITIRLYSSDGNHRLTALSQAKQERRPQELAKLTALVTRAWQLNLTGAARGSTTLLPVLTADVRGKRTHVPRFGRREVRRFLMPISSLESDENVSQPKDPPCITSFPESQGASREQQYSGVPLLLVAVYSSAIRNLTSLAPSHDNRGLGAFSFCAHSLCHKTSTAPAGGV
jgi:hypothetical protein